MFACDTFHQVHYQLIVVIRQITVFKNGSQFKLVGSDFIVAGLYRYAQLVTLDEIVRQVTNSKMTPEEKTTLKLGIGRIPENLLDTTDRNRTSPFAFTGNRFELVT